ncbi:MAG: hypothetical protein AAGL98_01460, partial [Planctomycetota bacterium]
CREKFFRDIYNNNPVSNKFRSSAAFFERVEDASFIDCAVVRVGFNPDVPHSVKANENQGFYWNSSCGELTVTNNVFADVAFCPVQGRSDATANLAGNVFLRTGGSAYVRQGVIRDFLHWGQTATDKDGGNTSTEAVMAQDSKLSAPEAVLVQNGLVAEPNDVPGWWRPYKARTPTRFVRVWAAEVEHDELVAVESSGVRLEDSGVIPSGYGDFRSPQAINGGVQRYIDAQATRGRGEWDATRHGAAAMLEHVGVTR